MGNLRALTGTGPDGVASAYRRKISKVPHRQPTRTTEVLAGGSWVLFVYPTIRSCEFVCCHRMPHLIMPVMSRIVLPRNPIADRQPRGQHAQPDSRAKIRLFELETAQQACHP